MKEWKECKLKDIIEINPTESLKKGTVAKKIGMDILQPYCRAIPSFSFEPYTGGTKFKNGDTIMARITPCLENGKTAMVNILEDNEIGFGSTEYIVFRAKNNITDPYFIYYLVTSDCIRNPAIKSMVGSSGRQRVQTDVVANLSINLPPLPTQQKIAAILSSLDDKIELNNKINTNLEQQAHALFKNWFVDFEPFGGKMPEGWKEKPLYDYADFINGTSFKEDEYDTKGVPIIKIAELKNGITDATQYFNGEKDPKYDVVNGDILFSWSGNPETSIDIFIWSLGNGILNQHTFNVKSNINRKWFTYCLLKYFKPEFCYRAACKQTTGLGYVTANDLKQITFCSGEKEESNFEALISPIMSQIFNNKIENQRLLDIRDTLLPKLMNGEIEV